MHHEVRKSCIQLFPIYNRTLSSWWFLYPHLWYPSLLPFYNPFASDPSQSSFCLPTAYLLQVMFPYFQFLIVFRLSENTKPVFLNRHLLLSEVLSTHIKTQYTQLRQWAPKVVMTKETCIWMYIMSADPSNCLLLTFIVSKECEIADS